MKIGHRVLSTLAFLACALGANAAHAAACSPATVQATDVTTWKPPVKGSGCTMDDATAFDAALNDPNATVTSLEASVSTACAACVFTQDETGANWQVYVWQQKADDVGFLNPDACLVLAGATADCSAADYSIVACEGVACAACTDSTTAEACAQASDTGTCQTYADAASTACSTADAAATTCGLDQATLSAAPIVMAVCGGDPAAGTGTSNNTSTSNDGTSGDTGDTTGNGNTNGTPSSGLSSGSPTHVNTDEPPTQTGGCAIGNARDVHDDAPSTALFAIGVVAVVGAMGKRSRRGRRDNA